MTQKALAARSALFKILPPALGETAPPWLRVRVHDLLPRMPIAHDADAVHFVLEGWIGARAVISDDVHPLCHVCVPGDAVGLEALWPVQHGRPADDPGSAPSAAYALGRARLASVPSGDMRRMVSEIPAWRDYALSELTRNLRSHHYMHAVTGGMVAPDRLIHFLYRLLCRHRAVTDSQAVILPLPLTQGEIGQVLGLTNVSVNRAFRTLEGKEMLNLDRGRVTFLREKAWVGELELDQTPVRAVRYAERA